MNGNPPLYNKNHPFMASIKERYPLCKTGSNKNTHHVILDLSRSGMTYEVGDSIAIFATYDAGLVRKTLQAMKATGMENIAEKHTGASCLLSDYLAHKANLSEVSRKFLSEICQRQTHPNKKERLTYLLSEENKDALKEYLLNHEVWDILEEHHEANFEPQECVNLLLPMLPRFYSIASSMKMVGEEVHLTVSYVKYMAGGHQRMGVCSHFLCDMAPLHLPAIPVYMQPHHGFTLPSDPSTDLIMVGPGTGIAPYRAFMQERMAQGAPGKNWLFFGEWNRAYDFFYEDFWKELQGQGRLQLDLAFSRDQEHKIYVQHRMWEQRRELFQWLEAGAYFFVCGDAHRMAKDVEATLLKIIQHEAHVDEQAAKAYLKKLRADKRYLRDVY